MNGVEWFLVLWAAWEVVSSWTRLTDRTGRQTQRLPVQHLAVPLLIGSMALPGAGSVWNYSDGALNGSAIFADVNGDGRAEVIVPAGDHTLGAWIYSPGGPHIQLLRTYRQVGRSAAIQATPAVANVPGTGLAIFAGAADGRVYGWNARTGELLPGWPATVDIPDGSQPLADLRNNIYGGVATGDLDGDGLPEILVPSINHALTAFHANGTRFWRYNNDDTILGAPVIGDIDRDGLMDVVFGGDSSQGAYYDAGGRITALSADGKRKWITQIDQVAQSGPALANLNHDGYLDIVIGTGYNFPNRSNRVYALDHRGNMLPGWPYVTHPNNAVTAGTFPSPAIADLLRNGELMVIIGDGQGKIHAIRPDGRPLWVKQAFTEQHLFASPIVADVNGDGVPDVIAATATTVRALSGDTGEQVWEHVDRTDRERYYCSPAIGHFKGDASWQLAITGNLTENAVMRSPSVLHLYDLGTSPTPPPWPMYRRDATGGNAIVRSDRYSLRFLTEVHRAVGHAPDQREVAAGVQNLRHTATLLPFIDGILAAAQIPDTSVSGERRDFQLLTRRSGLPPMPADSQLAASWDLRRGRSQRAILRDILNTGGDYARVNQEATFVRTLYRDLLYRNPRPEEVANWLSGLERGMTPEAVASSVVQSDEHRSLLVNGYYRRFLGRNARIEDGRSWVDSLAAGSSREEVIKGFIHSDEFMQRGGGTPQGFIDLAFSTILLRPPTPQDRFNWMNRSATENIHETLPEALLHSTEYYRRTIDDYFDVYLRRLPNTPPDGSILYNGIEPYAAQEFIDFLAAGGNPEQVQINLLMSPEYLNLSLQKGVWNGKRWKR